MVTPAPGPAGADDAAAPRVLTGRDGAIATVTLNRPHVRNALDLAMRQELEAALAALAADAAVRVVVLRGAGDHFCAGGDVKLMRELPPSVELGRTRVETLGRAILALARFRAPTIAMVDGAAVGAGCNLALACDLIVCSERATFGEVFARVGLVPDAGGSYFLSRRIGIARAKELVFTADVIDARAAERIGLVNRVVPSGDLDREVRALAARIVAGPPRALSAAKALLDDGQHRDLESALRAEAATQGEMIATADHREGVAAFLEKRPPRFTGQ